MSKDRSDLKSTGGVRRLIQAFGYSYAGLRHGIAHEASIRQELVACAILIPVSMLLPISSFEHLTLIISMMLVVLVEFLNSAIEAVIDRISVERHPLSAQAKDLGSAAVGVALLITGLCWFVIAGPVVLRWFGP
jgi:diacylglycerol kinase (ATP)